MVWCTTSPNKFAQPKMPPDVSMISKSRMPSSYEALGISENTGICPQLPAMNVRNATP